MKSIILITDSIPSPDGGGISQTMYNLFENAPTPLYVLTRFDEEAPQKTLLSTIIKYNIEKYRPWRNRFARWVNPFLRRINFEKLQKLDTSIPGLPDAADAVILVSTTSPIKLQLAYVLQENLGYTVIPYFMDDWLEGNKIEWKDTSGQKVDIHYIASSLLAKAPAWMMISEALQRVLQLRYQLADKPSLIVHNPVNNQQPTLLIPKEPGLIIYAGSIWPMHLDALLSIAKAVHTLQEQGHSQYRLVIYSNEIFWLRHKALLGGSGVSWGGFIAYEHLYEKLSRAWLLLCTASFEEKHQAFSRSSVQTKLTDYMNADRPVLYVGPSDGASGLFVRQWNCGYCAVEPNTPFICHLLQKIISNEEDWQQKAINGKKAIREHFNKEVISEKLNRFLQPFIMGQNFVN